MYWARYACDRRVCLHLGFAGIPQPTADLEPGWQARDELLVDCRPKSVKRIFWSSGLEATSEAPQPEPDLGDCSSENPEGGAMLQGDSTFRPSSPVMPIEGGMLLQESVFRT